MSLNLTRDTNSLMAACCFDMRGASKPGQEKVQERGKSWTGVLWKQLCSTGWQGLIIMNIVAFAKRCV